MVSDPDDIVKSFGDSLTVAIEYVKALGAQCLGSVARQRFDTASTRPSSSKSKREINAFDQLACPA